MYTFLRRPVLLSDSRDITFPRVCRERLMLAPSCREMEREQAKGTNEATSVQLCWMQQVALSSVWPYVVCIIATTCTVCNRIVCQRVVTHMISVKSKVKVL